MSSLVYNSPLLPWDPLPGENRRLKRIMIVMFFIALLIRLGVPHIPIPLPDRTEAEAIREELAQVVIRRQQELPPPPPVVKVKPLAQKRVNISEDLRPRDVEKKTPVTVQGTKPTSAEVKAARASAETKGVLAFKDSFSDMLEEEGGSGTALALGADARVSNAGRQAAGAGNGNGGGGARNLITGRNGSGGIGNIGPSRGYGTGTGDGVGGGSGSGLGGGGRAITGNGVQVARVQSGIGNGSGTGIGNGKGRPLTGGAGPARTDEEIQIVFDRYKSALYRLYNRELRNDPSLRGKMVLALTIEPDGRVSSCRVQSSDLDSAVLNAEVVEKVLKFDFGAKEGVPATKIIYPIDFLPSA
jgi:outer membrane biosynthesis protein TonB